MATSLVATSVRALVFLVLPAFGAWLQAQTGNLRSDLQTVTRELPARHPNLFFARPRAEFDAEAQRLDADLANLSAEQFYTRLATLIAGQRDAHTNLWLGGAAAQGFRALPIEFKVFPDGVYVIGAPADRQDLQRARLLGIGNSDTAAVLALLKPTISHENDFWFHKQVPDYLRNIGVLRGVGLAGAQGATYRLQLESGAEASVTLNQPGNPIPYLTVAGGFVPYLGRRTDEFYWFDYIPSERTLYFRYSACAEMPSRPFAAFADQMLAMIDGNPVDRIVVDLRDNGGGNQGLAFPLFIGIGLRMERLRANPDFRMIVLSNAGSFSSAMLHVSDLKLREIPPELAAGVPPGARALAAESWGEPTGGKPYAYGEVVPLALPSGLRVIHSTRFVEAWRAVTPERDAIYPDYPVSVRSTDYFSRHDPILAAAILNARTPAPAAPTGGALAVNSASFWVETGIAPNSWVSAFGSFGGSDNVRVNGAEATVAAATSGQVVFLVPPSTPLGNAELEVREGSNARASGTFEVTATGPGLFITNPADRTQPGAILNQDGTLNQRSAAARAGTILQVFGTGRGPTTTPRVWIGQRPAEVLFSGDVVGLPGLWQLNVRIPAAAGLRLQVPIVVEAGGRLSNSATVWVEPE